MTRTASTSVLLIAWAFGGCTHFTGSTLRVLPRRNVALAERRMYWAGEGVGGTPKIVVGLEEQRAFFFKGRRLVAETGISSGRNGFETPAGRYRIIQKDEKHVSNLYGDFVGQDGQVMRRNVDLSKDLVPENALFVGAPMPYFMRFSRGFGFHAGHLPGRPASHGCIRLPEEMARHFFQEAEIGTAVQIETSWLPERLNLKPQTKLKGAEKPTAMLKGKGGLRGDARGRRGPDLRSRTGKPGSRWGKIKAWFGLGRLD